VVRPAGEWSAPYGRGTVPSPVAESLAIPLLVVMLIGAVVRPKGLSEAAGAMKPRGARATPPKGPRSSLQRPARAVGRALCRRHRP